MSKAPDPQLFPGRRSVGCPLLQVCVHLDGLNAEHIDLYIAKLNRLNITDPYNALWVLLTCINTCMERFPDLQYSELPHQLSLLTLLQIKSNHFLLSHHHSTSALVSEILMSVLQTVQKNNRQFTYGQTVQKKQQTIYLWTDSAKKTTDNLHMDRQCKKLHWSIYSAPDSAKKQQQQFTYGQTVQKSNSNLHMYSTYLQTVQKTMCKIHIHILSTHSVL